MNPNIEKIDVVELLVNFFRTLRRMWPQVLGLIVIFTLMMTLQANFRYVPYYTAYSTFTVNVWNESEETDTAYLDGTAAEQMATTFPNILTSGLLQRKVAEDLDMDYMSGTINATVLENTNLFTISITDTDPKMAQKTLKSVIKNYPSVSEDIIGKVNMDIFDESGVPKSPDNPKSLKEPALKGAMMGAGLGLAWTLLASFLRRTIRRKEDCIKKLNKRCLGTVPQVNFKERSKKKIRHINITKKSVDPKFKEAIRIIRNRVKRYTREESMKKLIITSALAGEGKSTIAVNLAISLAMEGKTVALIDCDLRNPSDAAILNVKPEKGLIDFLKGEAPLKDCLMVASVIDGMDEHSKFMFLPGGEAIGDGSGYLDSPQMKEAIDAIEKACDFVILDSAPVGLLTDASVLAEFADAAMFIVRKDFAKVDSILSGIEHLSEGNLPVIGCVLNGN